MTVVCGDAAFLLGGDPDQIAASASGWTAFAAAAACAADDLRGLDTADFVGDEADDYRGSLDTDLACRLRTASQAWAVVGTALAHFSAKLDDCQDRMGNLRARAGDTRESLRGARQDLAAAHAADRAQSVTDHGPGGSGGYRSESCPADARLAEATTRLQLLMAQACSVRAEHDAAREACVAEIRRAAGMRFADPPGWFARLLSSAGEWIADHAPLLRSISAVLKQISSIAGLLAVIPVLAPVMGPFAAGTGVMAAAIDGAVMAATGQGSWTGLALQAAGLLPGARTAMAVGAAEAAVAAGHAAAGDGSWTDVAMVVAGAAIGGKGMHGSSTGRHADAPVRGHAVPEPGTVEVSTHHPDIHADKRDPIAAGHYDDHAGGWADDGPATVGIASEASVPAHLPPGLEDLYRAGKAKVPVEWGEPIPNGKGEGLRWFAANKSEAGVRIDRAVPASPYPSQRVDHVIVRDKGRVLFPDGTPIRRSVEQDWQSHIPLSEWMSWQEWNKP